MHHVLCAYALHCTQNIVQSAQCTLIKLHARHQALNKTSIWLSRHTQHTARINLRATYNA